MPDLKERLKNHVAMLLSRCVKNSAPIENIYYLKCNEYKKGSTPPDVKKLGRPFARDDKWAGEPDYHAWFYFEIDVPKANDGERNEIYICTDADRGWDATNPQFIVYMDGKTVQGLDINHRSFIVTEGKHEIYIYAYNGFIASGTYGNAPYRNALLTFIANLNTINCAIEDLYTDLVIAYDVVHYSLHPNTRDYADILEIANKAICIVDWRDLTSERFTKSVIEARTYLRENMYENYGTPIQAVGNRPETTAIGHTHIDIAWLWTTAQTREKAQRSFATVLNNMERFPDYKFMSSQAYLYKAVKEEDPALYERIKQKIKEGRWEVEGAMWVEADCNLSSGESLVRQVLVGKNFFKKEFGVDSKALWLPDVFGYSPSLPQILKKSGVDYFVTSKISWNDHNTMPNDTFNWQGIDGTNIFTHFLTATSSSLDKIDRCCTYNALGFPGYVSGTYNRYKNKNLTNKAIITYGYGDGGGGPIPLDIDRLTRMSYGVRGLPVVKQQFAMDFIKAVENDARKRQERLPRWTGELYLEFHRGTYTSQAKNKRNNRKAEYALQNAEMLSSMAEIYAGKPYPKDVFDKQWEIALTNQFHDIIPGSSIKAVYDQTDKEYAELFEEIGKVQENALSHLAKGIKVTDGEIAVFNPHSFVADAIVSDGEKEYFVKDLKPKAISVVKPFSKGQVKINGKVVENDYFKVIFDDNYDMISVYDKLCEREILLEGKKGNELVAYEDFPPMYDNWELRDYYNEKSYKVDEILSAESFVDETGAGFKIVKKFEKSTICQKIKFYNDVNRIDFITDCDWQNEHIALKAHFPIDVNTDKATFDVQFGNVERSTTDNTSWDEAKFEVCAHKYADVSESDYGVAIINDCKYGYSVKGTDIGLTMLKCGTEPDETADKGKHEFTYSLFAHNDTIRNSDTFKVATLLNNPPIVVKAEKGAERICESVPFVAVDKDNVLVETVKKAEDGNGYIVRLYETLNKRATVKIDLGFKAKKIYLSNLIEEDICEIENADNFVNLTVKPFEIITLRVII